MNIHQLESGIQYSFIFPSDLLVFLDDWFLHDRVIISENGYEDLISDHPTVIVTQGKTRGTQNAAFVFWFFFQFLYFIFLCT